MAERLGVAPSRRTSDQNNAEPDEPIFEPGRGSDSSSASMSSPLPRSAAQSVPQTAARSGGRSLAPSTSGSGRRSARSNRRAAPTAAPVTAKRSFRMPEVVLGVLLVAGCALGAVLWQRSATTTSTVVVAARSIPRGTVITGADLRGAEMGGEVSALIPGSQANTLLGKVAAVDIATDAPLNRSLVNDESPLGQDEALTSMALEPGEVPPDLAPGDHVRIVVTSATDAIGANESALLAATAAVWSVDLSPDGISVIVTVRGPLSLSTDIAASTSVRLARVDQAASDAASDVEVDVDAEGGG